MTNNGKTVKIGCPTKLSAGDEVVVDAPAPRDLADIRPRRWTASRIVHLDEDIVVVDKPAEAHPLTRLARPPTVISRAHGEGISVATSGAAERWAQCTAWTWAQRLDGRSPQRTRLHRTQAGASRNALVDKVYHMSGARKTTANLNTVP